jgi:NAD(P)H-dependent flavin oxidoreductase YrpB (nitropropane dioxygenase family)
MFETKITKMLGIQYPIVGGNMMWITNAEFTAAISNAGGLGILCSVMYETQEAFGQALDTAFDLTAEPFAVNINLFPMARPVDPGQYLEIAIKKGVEIVETSGRAPSDELCQRIKEAGLIWIHKCVGLRYAQKAEQMGADIVTVVGFENGGATGKLDIGTLVLVPCVADGIKIPLIGGGGVSDGRGLLAVLSLGAEAIIMGTRLLATREAPIHENLKKALVDASELDTLLVMRTIGSTQRVWSNQAAKKCFELEECQATFEEILDVVGGQKAKKMYVEGDTDMAIMSCGQCVGSICDIPTVKDLFERMMAQAAEAANKFKYNYGGQRAVFKPA